MRTMIEKFMLKLGFVPVAKYRRVADDVAHQTARARAAAKREQTPTGAISVQVAELGRKAEAMLRNG